MKLERHIYYTYKYKPLQNPFIYNFFFGTAILPRETALECNKFTLNILISLNGEFAFCK